MSAINILDLNDDCLGYVLNHLSSDDFNSFAQVCCRFRDVFIDRCGKRNRQFTLDGNSARRQLIELCICRESVQTLTIDIDHFDTARTFRSHGCETPTNCFNTLCYALEGMVSLRCLVLKQLQFILIPIEKPFEQIFAAVKNLSDLKILEVRTRDDWTFDNIWQLSHLEELQLHVRKIGASVLAKCCKSNPNLRILHLGYDCVEGNLKDIVSHCGNLETLRCGMMAEAAAYKPLARLPKLRKLTHYGIRRKDSFLPVLTALAERSQLRHLEIDGGSLSPEEMLQVVRLKGLQELKCFCLTAECVEMLAQLTELTKLCLWMSSRPDISNALLKVLRECKKLQLLRVATGNLSPNFINDVAKLLTQNRDKSLLSNGHFEIVCFTKSREIQKLRLQIKDNVIHLRYVLTDQYVITEEVKVNFSLIDYWPGMNFIHNASGMMYNDDAVTATQPERRQNDQEVSSNPVRHWRFRQLHLKAALLAITGSAHCSSWRTPTPASSALPSTFIFHLFNAAATP
ncbi:hypothetical protein ACLKA7_015568 [Drosophila subpalustris]